MNKYYIGTIWDTNNCGKIEILDKEYANQSGYTIKFLEDGTILKNVRIANLSRGCIDNPNRATVHGKGYRGIGAFNISEKISKYKYKHKKEYVLWNGMLGRCYNEEFLIKNPTYKGCSVDERWLNFQNFCEDLPKIENYDKWLELGGRFYHLDKDFKVKGNKIYSLDTCVFLDAKENARLGVKSRLERNGGIIRYNVIINGVLKMNGSVKEISKFLNISLSALYSRIYKKTVIDGVEILRYYKEEVKNEKN